MGSGVRDLLLGVDAGQTVTKACVFDRKGRELGAGSARVELSTPRPHWVERDMEAVWQATATAIRRALAAAQVTGERVAAAGIVGHNDGLYLLDENAAPVRPAVTAMDTRAGGVLAEWRRSAMWARALELTGQVPFAGSPSALLAWFARYEPDVLDRARWVVFCKDWLRFRLTGAIATDASEASSAFTSVRTQDYAGEALALYGLERFADRLPPILPSHAIAGEVTEAAARATGLVAGTPVVTGAHDVDGTAVGTGVVHPGLLSLVGGTFSINQVVSTSVVVDERWQARSFVQPGRWLNMSTSPSSATNLDWWRKMFGLGADDADYAGLEREAAAALDGPSQVLYHPFLYGSPYGESASAAFLGVRGWHQRGDLVRALMEGVVLGHRVHVDSLREKFAVTGVARLSGGVARSVVWSQMYADALDLEVEIPDCAETGARGAALLAGLGVGWYASLDELAEMVTIARRHAPDPGRREVLADTYHRFLHAASALRELWPELT
ncbi:FGGY-family carbohydrate kinase [Actinopolymorpha alba]|uniref:FGGY-family carbohydrate kinase n=1 Tax=Actinopolymorpha alba TaxID=533267 RepID=UPI000377B65E|nr:FGGY-family carbohydrate kinase [Actinopolymorpha alba]